MADAALENAMARRKATAERLDNVIKKINELVARHNQLKDELEQVDGFIRMWHEMAGTQAPPGLEQKRPEAPVEGGKRIRPRNPDRQEVAEHCVYHIRKAGRPLMRKDLMQLLAADGIEIRGKDPAMVLSTMLWRSKDTITRLASGGYWPTADMPPPAKLPDLL